MKHRYPDLYANGCLQERIDRAAQCLKSCTLCPRNCRVDRTSGETGVCGIGKDAVIASYGPHYGEESPLVGTGGSGTIFFCGCNLRCLFCQNYDISHHPEITGEITDSHQLASIMVELQERGCHNINFVTPSHVIPQILAALPEAVEKGLTVPLVYNSSAYDSVDSLLLMDNIIDIYIPDFKFWYEVSGRRYAGAADYAENARKAVKEMFRQVGDLELNSRGLAVRGMLIRHLVMPQGLDETKEILAFIGNELSKNSYVNVMDQYHPCGRASNFPEIDRPLTGEEYRQALEEARLAGLSRLDRRDLRSILRWMRLT